MSDTFEPWDALIDGRAEPGCRAVVIVPARNEEASIGATLDALGAQVDLAGRTLDPSRFEILLLLNNCTDSTAAVASQWRRDHPLVRLHVVERTLRSHEAFVGTARRMMMDTAWRRLNAREEVCGIISTDSDTQVSPDWVVQNMAALEAGADAVGGVILLEDGELQSLPLGVRKAYLRDRRYQRLVAQLEDCLDPQNGDRWPRHLEHFGASLAVTPEAYVRVQAGCQLSHRLEDVAFVGELRRVGAKLRHQPEVKVYTSSRLHGRVDVGLSGQLRIWNEMSERGDQHQVLSAPWLAHRFRTLGRLRKEASLQGKAPAAYLAEVDCDRMVAETFRGMTHGEITRVNRCLAAMLAGLPPNAETTLTDSVLTGRADSPRGVVGQ